MSTPLPLRVFAVASFIAVAAALGWMILSRPEKPAPRATPEALPSAEIAPTPPPPTPVPATQTPPLTIPKEVIANWQLPDGPEITSAFIKKWGSQNPAEAARWLSAQPDSPALHAGAERLAELWARADLHAATQWALTLPDDGIVKSVVIDRLAATWAEKDPLAATGYFARLPAGEHRKLGASALFDLWAKRDAAGMHGALGKIPAALADDARESLAPVLFPRNSTAAMNLLCDVKDRARRIAAISQLFDYWRRRNRGAATAWLAQSALSEEERQQIAVPQ